MTDRLSQLESRWEDALCQTRLSTAQQPDIYRELKSLAAEVVQKPLDIDNYFPTAERLSDLLHRLDPSGRGSIFQFFEEQITPKDLYQVRLLRMECMDLLDHIKAFETWRKEHLHLRVVK